MSIPCALLRDDQIPRGTLPRNPEKYNLSTSIEAIRLLTKSAPEELPKFGNVNTIGRPLTLSVTSLDLLVVGVIDLVAQVDGKQTVVD
ncbi:MAG: hypothetical protein ABSG14_09375 [Verrucomicrobiia bacterium]